MSGAGTAKKAGAFAPGVPVGVLAVGGPGDVLDYRAPEGGCAPGDLVEVPLGPRLVAGAIWGPASGALPAERLRPVARRLDAPPLSAGLRAFLERAADYTLSPPAQMLRLATRVPGLMGARPEITLLQATGAAPARPTPARARVLAALGGAARAPADLARAAGVSPGVVRGLVAEGVLAPISAPRDAPLPRLSPDHAAPALSPAQAAAAAALAQAVRAGGYGTTLLKGVTGSGKTEVYLDAVAEALRAGRQALVLLPEIALTEAFLARVEARFGARPAEWHSGLAAPARRRAWHGAASGAAGLVVGARSALFLPFADLALIVVDEEHDATYKQEDGVLYNARDMAVLRASVEGAQVVLASATPSLETWVNAEAGKYARRDLPARFGGAALPEIATIDMRAERLPAGRWISAPLAHAVQAEIAAGRQALLFLNRRGYAPVTLCRACGAQIGCENCDARMVEHRFSGRLMCHQCGATRPVPKTCPGCGAEDRLTALGPGVERLAEEAQAQFPAARIAVLSSDLFESAGALKAQITAIAEGGADLVIGTQLVAKGHNFPLLGLVGVIDADLGLAGADLRAGERTFQLMRQVAGRAGRMGGVRGRALLQTYQPEHPVIRAILGGDEEGFWRAEAAQRKAAFMPPFARLAGVILSAREARLAFEAGQALARADGPLAEIGAQVFGPAPAPIARVRGRHRVRLLVRAPRAAPLQAALRRWVAAAPPPGPVRLQLDIDPQSFL